MDRDKILIYTDHVGRFYAQQYSFPPMVGRLIGYLGVCQPAEQTINDIAEALLASRSAVNNAIAMLETQQLIKRTRPAGTRADLVSFNPNGWQTSGFNPNEYIATSALIHEGLSLLSDGQTERREGLEKAAALNDYMAEQLPKIYEDFIAYYQKKKEKS